MAKGKIQPRVFKGTRDLMPADMVRRQWVTNIIRETFERYGYEPLETPSMEFWDILTGKYGEEGEKLIYRLAYRDARTLALRYDLTVPLARVVAMRPNLPRPFKRYQIQPVWRADNPQRGRFREFYQCDIDAVGSASPRVDAEIVAVMAEALGLLRLPPFRIRISSRRLLDGLAAYAGVRGKTLQIARRAGVGDAATDELEEVAAPVAMFRCMDKLDKIGLDGVRAELERVGFDSQAVDRTMEVLAFQGSSNSDTLSFAAGLVGDDEEGKAGVAEVEAVVSGAMNLGAPEDRLSVDLTLARGLDYYTGPVYETVVEEPKIGSLSGGGRYDGLIEIFGGKPVPAAGTTLGLERIVAVLDDLGLLPEATTHTQALVVHFSEAMIDEAMRVARELRAAGITCEVLFDKAKVRAQLAHAERKGIPFAVIVAPDELARGELAIKDLAHRRQESVPRDQAGTRLKELLGG